MDISTRRKPGLSRRDSQSRRRSWCCSFTVPPSSPENLSLSLSLSRSHSHPKSIPTNKSDTHSKPGTTTNSVPNSPQSTKSGLGLVGRTRIDPRRILSPGRVSPIDSDPTVHSIIQEKEEEEEEEEIISALDSSSSIPETKSQSFRAPPETLSRTTTDKEGVFDVRLNLRGKSGGCLVLELNSQVLSASSEVFASLIIEFKTNSRSFSSSSSSYCGSKMCRIEVPEVENLGVFRETIELMFEDDIPKRLLKIGVYRCIDILEVCAFFPFSFFSFCVFF